MKQKEPAINVVCFIILGWVNNFGYSVMLSAAKHMMAGKAPTSTVLLCDILPCFCVKLIFPFFLEKIIYPVKVISVVLLAILGFLLATFSEQSTGIALTGVVCHSLSSGLGEITYLAYSAKFSTSCVSAWSCGTGLAGITASGIYAILSDVFHVDLKIILYVFLPIPLLMLEAYYISNPKFSPKSQEQPEVESEIIETETTPLVKQPPISLTFKDKMRSLLGIWQFLLSLFLVYVSEYMINQSVNAVIDFKGSYQNMFYSFSQFAYQTGVFISRSSLVLFKLPANLVMVPSLLQFFNLILFSFQAEYLFIPWFWLMMALVFIEGLWGGLVYVDAMYWISMSSQGGIKEFRMSIASLFNSFGILTASFIGFWLEPYLKAHKKW
ncbi:CLN3_protein [Hexamita inflata]|uniref:CLN3 protein n=1 Tax=Hexamita inflata TaxID=28002 RepID=A0AA86PUB0_9EUKA|nr:CLN3 protein [Hexamita inflata]